MALNTPVPAARGAHVGWSARLLRFVAWILLGSGGGILLYLAYALLFTNVGAEQAQGALLDEWQQAPLASEAPGAPERAAARSEVEPVALPDRAGVALVEFERPGDEAPLVHDDPLVVLDGVGVDELAQGPGRYPGSALPGQDGNFAIAGHRTTYGAPFFHLEVVRAGDHILVTDRRGTRWTYVVTDTRIVAPSDTWVIGDDPLGTGVPTMTVTTCHPRFSAAERLVVHAELVS